MSDPFRSPSLREMLWLLPFMLAGLVTGWLLDTALIPPPGPQGPLTLVFGIVGGAIGHRLGKGAR